MHLILQKTQPNGTTSRIHGGIWTYGLLYIKTM